MSKADEMFKELGYKKETIKSEVSNEVTIMYKKPFVFEYNSKFIEFLIVKKIIKIDYFVDMQELQAINEKVKELGWND